MVVGKVGDAGFGAYVARGSAKERREREKRVIRYGASSWEPGAAWLATNRKDATVALYADDMPTVRAACAEGLGLAVLPHFYAAGRSLARVADGCDTAGLYVAVHPDLRRTARVRAVVSWLKAALPTRLAAAA